MLVGSVTHCSRREALGACAFALVGASSRALAQLRSPPRLEPPTALVREALGPFASHGAVLLIDDLDAGMFSRVTVLARVNASLEAVRTIIASPERYGDRTRVIRDVQIDSRRGPLVGFRFQASASIFALETSASLRVVSPRRIDVAIVRSDLGPGAARWDLFDDGAGGTLVACTAWGDPSRGHWLFRQVASRSPTTIPLMTAAVSLLLTLSLLGSVRRAAPSAPPTAAGSLEPLPPRIQALLPPRGLLGAISLGPDGTTSRATITMTVPASLDVLRGWLQDPTRYPQVWRSMRQTSIVRRSDREVLFSSTLETPMGRSRGTRALTLVDGADEVTALWRGIDGDERGLDLRWDLRRLTDGGTALSASANDQLARLGFPLRGTVEQEPGLRAGFAFGLAVAWARALARRVSPVATSPVRGG